MKKEEQGMDFTPLDTIDRKILRLLQRNGRHQNVELADRVGLSPSPCLRRVRILEEAHAIDRYVALVNPAAVGLAMTIFVRVTLERQSQNTVEKFAAEVASIPNVLECYLVAGGYDLLLKVVVRDLDDFRRIHMNSLGQIEGVRNVETEIPLQVLKRTTELPV
jgi:DNA-binding Lrp family transcriptional regulator